MCAKVRPRRRAPAPAPPPPPPPPPVVVVPTISAAEERAAADEKFHRMIDELGKLNVNVSAETQAILRENEMDLDTMIACKPQDYAEIGIDAMDQHRLFSVQPKLNNDKNGGTGAWAPR